MTLRPKPKRFSFRREKQPQSTPTFLEPVRPLPKEFYVANTRTRLGNTYVIDNLYYMNGAKRRVAQLTSEGYDVETVIHRGKGGITYIAVYKRRD
jgi:hypothetical protein